MNLLHVLTVIVIIQTWSFSTSQTLNDSETLIKDLLNSHDKKSRPILDQSKPLIINVSFSIGSLMELEEVDGKFFIGGIMYATWVDETKQWHPEQYGGIVSELLPYDELWHPIITLVSMYEEVDTYLKDWMKVKVFHNGVVSLNPAAVFKSRCTIDVTFYPFDTQHCNVYFASTDYSTSELVLHSESSDVPRSFYIEHGEWKLESTGASSGMFYARDDSAHSYVDFYFKYKRNSNFYVMNTIVPVTMMIVLNTFVFLLPPESGERVSYAITVLLAIAVFLSIIGDTLPQTSNPVPILSYFLVVTLSFSTLICMFAILNLRLYFKPGRPPAYLCRLAHIFCCCIPTSTKSDSPIKKYKNRDAFEEIDNGTTITDTDSTDVSSKDYKEFARSCTWKHIGIFVDRISSILFFVLIIVLTSLYLIVLVTNYDLFGISREVKLPTELQ